MTTLVVFGASGDLMKKKIAPALQALQAKGRLPADFRLVGFGRRSWTDADLRREVTGSVGGAYVQGQLLETRDYERLRPHLDGQTLFYLAVPPPLYAPIFERLSTLGLMSVAQARILVEKPFGNDAESAEALEEKLNRLFADEQIYRVDHYLAKTGLPSLVPGVSREMVLRIEILFFETIGYEGRGAFADATGALRDWHSHHLQALAYLLMRPSASTPAAIRAARLSVLQHLRPLALEEAREKTRRGQYEGFRRIEGVDPNSETETFFHVEAALDLPEWEGVPIILEAGKNMAEDRKEVVIERRSGAPLAFPIDARVPGVTDYETILTDALQGDQTLFVSSDEVRAMWRFVDPIVRAWKQGAAPLEMYQPGTNLRIENKE